MTDPAKTEKEKPIRNASYVSLATVALTVATAQVFAHAGTQLKTTAEYAVVAGFWISITSGGVWLWRRWQRRGVKAH